MSDLKKKAKFNAEMVEDHASDLAFDIERGNYEDVYMSVDSLMEYAGRLLRNLEAIDNEEAK